MEKVLDIIALIFLSMIWLTVMYGSLVKKQLKQFDMYLKDGDLVDYYDGEDRESYRVKNVGAIYCTIIDNETGKDIKVQRIELYPNFWHSYGPTKPVE